MDIERRYCISSDVAQMIADRFWSFSVLDQNRYHQLVTALKLKFGDVAYVPAPVCRGKIHPYTIGQIEATFEGIPLRFVPGNQ